MQDKAKDVRREICERHLPDFMIRDGKRITTMQTWEAQRKDMQDIICRELYGFMPFRESSVSGEILSERDDGYGGKAFSVIVNIRVRTSYGMAFFPVRLSIPKGIEKPPVFLCLTGPSMDMVEEFLDNGYAVAVIYYQDIMPDSPEAVNEGIAGIIEKVPYIGWGKVAMWAYGLSRAMDYLCTRDDIDRNRVAIMGHSRTGKATLLCGALDPRFSLVISSGSGAGGAALFRGKTGERVENLSKHWFCGNIRNYAGKEASLPFDQHYLLALNAPGRIYISSASEDAWADPRSEFLSCVAASPAYSLYEKEGLVYEDYPVCDVPLQEGYIAYHMRSGTHYIGRDDYHHFFSYRKRYHV